MNKPEWIFTLVIVSTALPVGWTWFRRRSTRWKNQLIFARLFYFVGLPYLALMTGMFAARFLGLKGLEYFVFTGLNNNFSLILFLTELQKAVSLLLLECLIDGWATLQVGLLVLLIAVGLRFALARQRLPWMTGFRSSALTTIYDSLHWAFYRAIFWQLSGDLYLGVVWGIAWVLLEWSLIAWAQKSRPTQQPALLWRSILLILTSTLFFYSSNLWLLWPIHLVLAMGVHPHQTTHPAETKYFQPI